MKDVTDSPQATTLRIGNLLLLIGSLMFLLGLGALVLAAGPESWADTTGALVYMVRPRWWLTLPLAVLVLGLIVAVVLLALLSARAAWRRQRPALGREQAPRPEMSELALQARRMLDMEISRTRPSVDRVVNVLLCAPGDLGVQAVSLNPGAMLVEIALSTGDQCIPVTSLPPPLYDEVLHQLRKMARVEESGDGLLELRSTRGQEQILVRLKPTAHGVGARLQVVSAEESARDTPTRDTTLQRRRSSSVVFRLEPPPMRDMRTGELPLMPSEEHEATDPGSAILVGLRHSGQWHVPPMPREVSRAEGRLRLLLGIVLPLLSLVTFWNAYGWGVAQVAGGFRAPWRMVTIHVVSSPIGEVVIEGKDRGRTPLTVTEPCSGRPISVLVRASGHTTWQWDGICPADGTLELSGSLQARSP